MNDDPADYADPLGLDWETDAFGTCNAPWDWVLNPNGCAARQAVDDFKRLISPKTAWWEKVLIVVSYAPIPVGRAARIGLVARLVFREGWSIRLSDRAFAVLSRFVRVARFDAALSGCVTRCFPAGTLVAMPGGARPIQSLHVGDTVLAEDPATGKVEPEPVQAVTSDPPSPLIGIALSDASAITATVDHLFWVDASAKQRVGGWLRADELRPGDHLRIATGATVAVTGLHRHAGRAVVYTLTVARDHTFFVGTARVLVHNAPGGLSLCLIIPRIGDTWGGPGTWGIAPPESGFPANYQEYVSGALRGWEYFVQGVKFDGYDPNRRVLLEAKDRYARFIGQDWFKGWDKMIEQVRRQLQVLPSGYTLEWHFSEQSTLQYVQGLLARNGINPSNLRLVYDPRPWR